MVEGLSRARVLELASARLLEQGNALLVDDRLRRPAGLQAAAVVDDCTASLAAGRVTVDRHGVTRAADLAPLLLDRGITLLEVMRAGAVLCDVLAEILAEVLAEAPPEQAWTGLRAAQSSVGERVQAVTTSYSALVMARNERHRRSGRRAVARELHDYVGSNLSLAQRHLELHRLHQERGNAAAARELAAAENVLGQVMGGTRRLMNHLRAQPPVAGLALALDSFVTATAPTAVVELRVDGDELLLAGQARDELYLICQEGLRNAFTHAHATRVAVSVAIDPGSTEAVIEDDGRGFDPCARSVPGHHGLAGMRERAHLLGGTLELTSSPGAGTRARVRFPTCGKGRP